MLGIPAVFLHLFCFHRREAKMNSSGVGDHTVNYWTTSSEQEQEEPHDEPSSASVASTNHPCLDLLPRVAAPGERRVLPSIASMYPLEQGIADYGRVPPGQLPGIDSLCGARFDLVARQVRTFAHAPLLSGNPERDAPFTFIPLVVPQRPADCPAFSSPPSSFGALRALNSQPRASLRRPTANEVEIQGSNATPWGMSRNELGQHELGNSPAAASVNNSGASSDAPLSRLSSIEDAATRPFPHTGSPSAQPSGSADQAMPTVSITRPPWLEELKKSDGTFYFEPLRMMFKTRSATPT